MIPQRRDYTLAYAAAVLALAPAAATRAEHWKNIGQFEQASIRVERNATDGDTEIVLAAKPLTDLGLKAFSVLSPHWRRVVDVAAPRRSQGLREFLFETPEPEAAAILAEYPEGDYLYFGVAIDGQQFLGSAVLAHTLPGEPTILSPLDGEEVPAAPFTIQWTAVPDAAEYLVEIENESVDPERSFAMNVPAGVTSFAVPLELIDAGSEYQVGVAAVHENGNVVFVEVAFSTAGGAR